MTASESTLRAKYPTGLKVGKLTFVGLASRRGDRARVLGEFVCDCGGRATYPVARILRQKARTHCGCDANTKPNLSHGMRHSPEYSSWQAMCGRCLSPTNKDFPRYGGAGISLHAEWARSFSAFFAHIGPRPEGTTIDRIDSRRGYEPGNVRWATAVEQGRNRRSTFDWHIKGRIFLTAQEAADEFGVSEHTVWRWVNGQFDARRGTFSGKRKDCHVTPRY